MRILVIGGTGFIGSHTVRYLLDEGHEVMVFHIDIRLVAAAKDGAMRRKCFHFANANLWNSRNFDE